MKATDAGHILPRRGRNPERTNPAGDVSHKKEKFVVRPDRGTSMTAQLPDVVSFLKHLGSERAPFVVRRTPAAPRWADQAQHETTYRRDPELYALCGVADDVRPEQRARCLFQLLAQSRVNMAADTRHVLDRVTAFLLTALEPDQVLTVFLALRRARCNHKHLRRSLLRYLLNHPRLEEVARRRRPACVDCLEHALGKNVARACVRLLAEGDRTSTYLRRHLLRFADDAERAAKVVLFLYRHGDCPAAITEVSLAPRTDSIVAARTEETPRTITATNRGEIAATLVHIYRGGGNDELNAALERYVREAADSLPRFDGTVALVLDASASTRGYGEREFCVVSQSEAFRRVLEQCAARVRVFPVGGPGNPPQPEGDTDLAAALLDALEADADVVAVVSDGYENYLQGDLGRVVASLPAAGVQTPVVYCHSKFSGKDDLDLRKPAPELPELEFWHQRDFAEVLWLLFAHARPPRGEAFVRTELRRRLACLEDRRETWIGH
jgi:hypothetical protein